MYSYSTYSLLPLNLFPFQAYAMQQQQPVAVQQQQYAAAQPVQQQPAAAAPAGGTAAINPSTGQPDYSAQWAEYYRNMGMHDQAAKIEAQMRGGGGAAAGGPSQQVL